MKNLFAIFSLLVISACGRESSVERTACGIPAPSSVGGTTAVSLRWATNGAQTEGCCATENVAAADLSEVIDRSSACEVTSENGAYFIDCWAITGGSGSPSNTRSSTCEWAGHYHAIPAGQTDSEYWLDH